MSKIDLSRFDNAVDDRPTEPEKPSKRQQLASFPDAPTKPTPEENYQASAGSNPSEVAEVNDISKRLQTNPTAVRRDVPKARHAAQTPDWAKIRAGAPTVNQWSEDPRYMAYNHDDIESQAAVEGEIRATPGRILSAGWYQFKNQFSQQASANVATLEAFDIDDKRDRQRFVLSLSQQDKAELGRLTKEGIDAGLPANVVEIEATRTLRDNIMASSQETLDDPAFQIPEEFRGSSSGFAEDVVRGMAGSSFAMATQAVNPAVGLAFMFNQMKGAKVEELKQQGITDPKVIDRASTLAAVGQAPLEFAGNMIQFRALGKVLDPGSAAVGLKKFVAKFVRSTSGRKKMIKALRASGRVAPIASAVAESAMGEGLEEYLQAYPDEMANVFANNPDDSIDVLMGKFVDSVATLEFQGAAAYSGAVGAVSGALFVPVTSIGVRSVEAVIERAAIKEQTGRDAVRRFQVAETLKATALLERDPEAAARLVNEASVRKGQSDKIFLQADLLIEIAGEEAAIEFAEAHGVSAGQLADAVENGQDLALNRGTLAVTAAKGGNEVFEAISDDLRDAPDAASVRSVDQEVSDRQALRSRAQKLRQEAITAQGEQIDSLVEQVVQAAPQLFPDDVRGRAQARAAVGLVAAHSVVAADALSAAQGRVVTPAEVMAQSGLSVQRGEAASVAPIWTPEDGRNLHPTFQRLLAEEAELKIESARLGEAANDAQDQGNSEERDRLFEAQAQARQRLNDNAAEIAALTEMSTEELVQTATAEASRDVDVLHQRAPLEQKIPGETARGLILPHGKVENALQDKLDAKGGDPSTLTARVLANTGFGPKKRKGKEKLDKNVKPIGYNELKSYLEWSLAQDQALDWYDDFGKGFVKLVGDANMQEASVLFGITSAQNAAEVNFADTLHIMALARKFDPITQEEAFRDALANEPRPDGAKLKISGKKDGKGQIGRIVKLYQTGTYEGGLKVSTYMQAVKARAENRFFPYSVQDVHMSRVFGYRRQDVDPDTGNVVDSALFPSTNDIRYGQWLTTLLADEFNMPPHRVQALLWFYGKENLSPQQKRTGKAKVGAGTFEAAAKFAQPEIVQIQDQIESGQFNTEEALNGALVSGDAPAFRATTALDPYTNVDLNMQLEALAESRGFKALVSTKPGNARELGFPEGTDFERLVEYHHNVLDAITGPDGQINFLREAGIPHKVDIVTGTWEGLEPTFQVTILEGDIELANDVARVLGDALLQDAAITFRNDPTAPQFGLLLGKEDNSEFSPEELAELLVQVNPDQNALGINFTTTSDNKSIKFLDNTFFERLEAGEAYGDTDIQAFGLKLSELVGEGFTMQSFGQEGEYNDLVGKEGFSGTRFARSPDLQRAVVDQLYRPVWSVYSDTFFKVRGRTPGGQNPLTRVSPGFSRNTVADARWAAGRISLRTDGTAPLTHWSNTPGLERIDPEQFGTAAAGKERGRVGPGFAKRSFYGLPGYRRESVVPNKARYFGTINPGDLYDWQKDPLAIAERLMDKHQAPSKNAIATEMEQEIVKLGYSGYYSSNNGGPVVALFDELDVTDVTSTPLEETDMAGHDEAGKVQSIQPLFFFQQEEGDALDRAMSLHDWLQKAIGFSSERAIDVIDATADDRDGEFTLPTGAVQSAAELQGRYAGYLTRFQRGLFQAETGMITRGAFDPLTNTISLFEQADMSTLLHEMGHFFLQSLENLHSNGALVEEYETFQVWAGEQAKWVAQAGTKGADTAITAEDVEQAISSGKMPADAGKANAIAYGMHELFARGFETYLFEGKAPTPQLQDMFERFKKWLVSVYKVIKGIGGGVQLNDDIRQVFDRLLATEEQLQAAVDENAMVAMFDEAELSDLGMSPDQIARYTKTMRERDAEASRVVDSAKFNQAKATRKRQENIASKEYDELDVVTKLRALIADDGGLNKKMLNALVGFKIMKEIVDTKVGSTGLWRKPMPPTIAAERMGYASTDEMIEALSGYQTLKAYTEERVEELEGLEDNQIDKVEAVKNAKYRKQLQTESEALARQLDNKPRPSTARALRRWAEKKVGSQTPIAARDIYKLIQTNRRLRRQAIGAQQRQDYASAYQLNEKVRRNEELITAHSKARKEVDRMDQKFRKIARFQNPSKKTFEQFDYGVAQQLLRLSNRFGFAQNSQLLVDEEHQDIGLAQFFAGRDKSKGDELDLLNAMGVDEWIFSEGIRGDWRREFTMTEVREVERLVDHLNHIGDEKVQGQLLTEEGRLLEEEQAVIAEPLQKLAARKVHPEKHGLRRWLQRKREQADAEHVLPQYLSMIMDGFDESGQGPNAEWFKRLSDANGAKFLLIRETASKIKESTDVWEKSAKDREIPEQVVLRPGLLPDILARDGQHWDFEKSIATALNMGNVDNILRMVDGYGLIDESEIRNVVEQNTGKTKAEIRDAIRAYKVEIGEARLREFTETLSDEDWDAVQNVWDTLEASWPEMNRVHKKLHGAPQKKVEPRELRVGEKLLSGGYYPLVYNPFLSRDAKQKREKADILATGISTLAPPGVDVGSMKARLAGAGGQPVWLTLRVIPMHAEESAAYITHALLIKDLDRLYHGKGEQISEAVDRVVGPRFFDTVRPTLSHVFDIKGIAPGLQADQTVRMLKGMTTSFVLGLNHMVAAKQVTSLAHVIKVTGAQEVGKAYAEAMNMVSKGGVNQLIDHVHAMSPMMAERWNNQDADIRRRVSDLLLNKATIKTHSKIALTKAQDGAWIMIRVMDFVAAYPGWIAAYNHSLKSTNNHQEAVRQADFIISATQPTNRKIDKALVQRTQNSAVQFFNMFMSYTLRAANMRQLNRLANKSDQRTVRENARHWAFDRIAPAFMASVFVLLLKGSFWDDDKTGEEIAKQLAFDLMAFQAAGRVILGSIVSAIFSPYREPFGSPALDVPKDIFNRAKQHANSDYYTGEEFAQEVSWDIFRLFSFVARVPASEAATDINRFLEE